MKTTALVIAALLVCGSPAPAAEGDPAHGAEIYQRCIACHSLDRNRSGPMHCGLFGRRAGSVPGYAYSQALGWDYQTFGYWTLSGTNAATGGFSVGMGTAPPAIPIAGTATFSGKLFAAQPTWEFAAPMTLNVDFAARTAQFSSADWRAQTYMFPGTALSGTLTYSANQNALAGTLTSANGQYAGPVTGQFYGPHAEEVGGAFALSPTGGSGDPVVGGFGAKR